jgi:hypothetical protein
MWDLIVLGDACDHSQAANMDVIASQFMGEQGPFYDLETVDPNRRFVEADEPFRHDCCWTKVSGLRR